MKLNNYIGIVILNYNSYADTIEQYIKYKMQTEVELRFYIVDNNSTDESVELLHDYFFGVDNCQFIISNINGGYAKGNNIGIQAAINDGIKYLVISNNDITFKDNRLLYKLRESYIDDKMAFISPTMIVGDNKFVGSKINTLKDDIISLLGKNKKELYSENNTIETEIVPGSFIFSTTDKFKLFDFFDERTFLYCEERILAKKVKLQSKYRNYIISELSYLHEEGGVINDNYKKFGKMKLLCDSRIVFYSFYSHGYEKYLGVFVHKIFRYLFSFLERIS
ncbi:glycosyltransferase [Photobacterium damselae]|uniref:glycosyltransferase n=1 Tax=Photobacterium damselae TaxID=38293 RepID=UPI001EDD390F|nr:glycosyltransferase [Photobacterium damselae]MCG3817832.1 glycosyltransferase [Photobacterium damselae]